MNNRRLQSGGALLVTLLIVSVIGVLGFGLARVALLQQRVRSLSDATLQAYQAASAGLEYALLQYATDRDEELSWPSYNNPSDEPVVPEFISNNGNIHSAAARNFTPLRYQLTAGQTGAAGSLTTTAPVFDVTTYFQTFSYGAGGCFYGTFTTLENFLACDTDPTHPLLELKPDQSVSLTLTAATDNIRLRARMSPDPADNISCQGALTDLNKGVLVVDAFTADNSLLEQKTINLAYASHRRAYTTNGYIGYLNMDEGARRLNLTFYGPEGNCATDSLVLALQAVKMDDDYNLEPIGTGLTTIDVVGHANGADRRLRATIDRTTDRVIGVFDYALYAESNIFTSP